MTLSIRARLLLFTLAIVALVTAGVAAYSVGKEAQRILDAFVARGEQSVRTLARSIADGVYSLNVVDIDRLLRAARVNPDITASYAIDADGVILADGTDERDMRNEPFAPRHWLAQAAASPAPLVRLEGEQLHLLQRVELPGQPVLGYAYLQMSAHGPLAERRSNMLDAVMLAAVALLLSSPLVFLLARSFSRPLQQMVTAARAVAAGDLATRADDGRRDEFGQLAHAINDMMEALQRTSADEKRAREAAEAASRAKSQFLAMMSHEIRTPMNGVLGMTELLLQRQLGGTERAYAEIIQRSGRSLLAIINDILDFSRIEAGKLHVERIALDPRELVAQVADLLAEPARQRGLALLTQWSASVPARMLGDPGRLRQVLINLVGNGIKFTERGQVAIDLDTTVASDGRLLLHLRVSDTGIGISAAVQARLFEPFFQGDGSTTRRFGGTGLGLAISRQLVELMGGRLDCESEPGRGSVFTVTLPVETAGAAATTDRAPAAAADRAPAPVAEAAPAAAPPVRPPAATAPLRVLLAEDNPVNQQVGLAMLEACGCEPRVAASGLQALAELQRAPVDVVLMDCQMPEMDGFEATREIRRLNLTTRAGDRLPIIAMTANALPGDRDRCIAAGMDDYLSKPFALDDLRRVLARWSSLAVEAEALR